MINLIVAQLEKIKSPLWKAFAFRVYNVFKSVILPIVAYMVYERLKANPNDLSCLLEGEFWTSTLYAVIIAVLGSTIAGLDKVSRMTK